MHLRQGVVTVHTPLWQYLTPHSLPGGTLVVLSFVIFKRLRSTSRSVVACLSLTALLGGLFMCTVQPQANMDEGALCDALAIIGIYIAMTSFGWTCSLSFYVLMHLRRLRKCLTQYSEYNQSYKDKWFLVFFHLLSWGLPIPICVVIIVEGKEGPSLDAPWCFIPDTNEGWRLCYYVPLALSVLFVLGVYLLTLLEIYRLRRIHVGTVMMNQKVSSIISSRQWLIKLSLVALLFVICRMPGLIYRLVEYVCDPVPPFLCSSAYLCIMTIGDASQGIVLGLIFVVFNEATRAQYLDCLTCKLCRNHESNLQRKPLTTTTSFAYNSWASASKHL
ncbi:cAMP receptor-like G-protein coupled receptor [Pelomyxa schiedti]|nr:cAMP receptor-like G-protein coupled receptor [Pelomyxa schiedti]